MKRILSVGWEEIGISAPPGPCDLKLSANHLTHCFFKPFGGVMNAFENAVKTDPLPGKTLIQS